MELIIFVSFLSLQAAAKFAPHAWERIQHFVLVQRIARHHWVVWIFHPVVLHSIHEYAIHVVVYSGYIIRAH